MSRYKILKKTSSKSEEIKTKLGTKCVWTNRDTYNKRLKEEDEEIQEFFTGILSEAGFDLRLEDKTYQSQLTENTFRKKTYKEDNIFPSVVRKKLNRNANVIEGWIGFCEGKDIATISIKNSKDKHDYRVLTCPGTFGNHYVRPHWAVLTNDVRCDVKGVRKTFAALRTMGKAFDKVGAHFQYMTNEITIKEHKDGTVSFHPHVNVLFTVSKHLLGDFNTNVIEKITKGRHWRNEGEIKKGDTQRIVEYINKGPNDVKKKTLDSDKDNEDKGKNITLVELAERHPEIFIEYYRQLHGISMVSWGNELKAFNDFLTEWGHDIRKKRLFGEDHLVLWRKSSRIIYTEKLSRQRKRDHERDFRKYSEWLEHERVKDKILLSNVERDDKIAYLDIDTGKLRRTQKNEHQSKINTVNRNKELTKEQKTTLISNIRAEGAEQRRQITQGHNEKKREIEGHYKYLASVLEDEYQEDKQKREQEYQRKKAHERACRYKSDKSDNVILFTTAPFKNMTIGAYDTYVVIAGYEPDTSKQSKFGRERWSEIQRLRRDYQTIARNNGFDFEKRRPTEIVSAESYLSIDAGLETLFEGCGAGRCCGYDINNFIDDVKFWYMGHYEKAHWQHVDEKKFDDKNAQKLIEIVRKNCEPVMCKPVSMFLYGRMILNNQNLSSPALNWDFLPETGDKIYTQIIDDFQFETIYDHERAWIDSIPIKPPPDNPQIAA